MAIFKGNLPQLIFEHKMSFPSYFVIVKMHFHTFALFGLASTFAFASPLELGNKQSVAGTWAVNDPLAVILSVRDPSRPKKHRKKSKKITPKKSTTPAYSTLAPTSKLESHTTAVVSSIIESPVISSDYITGILRVHNAARAEVGLQPLIWDDKLAVQSTAWSHNFIDTNGGFLQHGMGKFGENLASYGDTASDAELGAHASQMWVDEKALWLGSGDKVLKNQNFEGYGHYTQVVWASTKYIGCGSVIDTPRGNYFVTTCRYLPEGNALGRAPY